MPPLQILSILTAASHRQTLRFPKQVASERFADNAQQLTELLGGEITAGAHSPVGRVMWRLLLLLVFVLVTAGCWSPRDTATASGAHRTEPIRLSETPAKIVLATYQDGDVFTFSVNGVDYRCKRDGTLSLRRGRHLLGTLSLRLGTADWLTSLQYVQADEALLLVYEMLDGEDGGGWGAIARLSDASRPYIRWSVELPGADVAQAVIESQLLYVGGSGFVGCLDVKEARWRWLHGNLSTRFHILGFDRASVYADQVVFPERPVDARRHSARRVVVDTHTGGLGNLAELATHAETPTGR